MRPGSEVRSPPPPAARYDGEKGFSMKSHRLSKKRAILDRIKHLEEAITKDESIWKVVRMHIGRDSGLCLKPRRRMARPAHLMPIG
jgi:hypothetical protein